MALDSRSQLGRDHLGHGKVEDSVRDKSEGLRCQVLDQVQGSACQLVDEPINLCFVGQQERVDQLLVDDAGSQQALPDRNDEPEQRESLDFVVEGKPEEEDVSEGLEKGKDREHNPVHHPFYVLVSPLGPKGLEGGVSRVQLVEEQLEHVGQQVRLCCEKTLFVLFLT